MTIKVQLKREVNGVMQQVNPITSEECVILGDGKKLNEVIDFATTAEDFVDETIVIEENLVDRVESIENRIVSEFEQQNSQITTGLSNIKTIEQNISNKVDTEVAKVNTQLLQIKNKPLIPEYKLNKVIKDIAYPKGFTFTPDYLKVYRGLDGDITAKIDLSQFQYAAGKTYYVDVNGGSNANDGLTVDTAFKTLTVALSKEDVGTIYVRGGYYQEIDGFNSNTTLYNKSYNIKAYNNEKVYMLAGRVNLSWTKEDGYNYVYKTNRSKTVNVIQMNVLDNYGDELIYKKVNSIVEVENTVASYYFNESTNDLYIHTYNSKQPESENVAVLLNVINAWNSGGNTVYFEGINFYGGNKNALTVTAGDNGKKAICICKNCSFKFATEDRGGFHGEGVLCVMLKCVASHNSQDGFNYHRYGTTISESIEIDCIGRFNGVYSGAYQNNGSTTHGGCKAIRINCEYFGNGGPNIHDINENTQSWNIGCVSNDSKAEEPVRNTNYRAEDQAILWIDSCVGGNSYMNLYASETCTIYLKNSLFDKDVDEVYGQVIEY